MDARTSCAGILWQQQLETHYEQSLKSGETILKTLGIVTATVLSNPEQ